jgi:integrase
VAGYAPKWLDGLLVEPNTRLAYGLSLKHIIACIGGAAVAEVDGGDIRKIIRHMEKLGLADNTIRHALVVADLMFASAVPKLRDDNPATDVKKKFKVRDEREKVFATREQAKAIEDAIQARYKLLVRTLFATGMRWGEAIAVKGTNVEKRGDGYVLKVRRTVGETSGVGVYLRNYGKTAKAKRDITIPDSLAADLMAFGDKPCFVTTRGTWLRRSDFRQHAWQPAVKAAGIPMLRIHGTRDSHATWLANHPRVPLSAVRDRLGHSSLTTTSKYVHVMPGNDPCLTALGGQRERRHLAADARPADVAGGPWHRRPDRHEGQQRYVPGRRRRRGRAVARVPYPAGGPGMGGRTGQDGIGISNAATVPGKRTCGRSPRSFVRDILPMFCIQASLSSSFLFHVLYSFSQVRGRLTVDDYRQSYYPIRRHDRPTVRSKKWKAQQFQVMVLTILSRFPGSTTGNWRSCRTRTCRHVATSTRSLRAAPGSRP